MKSSGTVWRRDASWVVGNVDVHNGASVIFRGALLNVSLSSLRGNLLKRRHQCQHILKPFKKLRGDVSTCCFLPIGSEKAPTASCLLSRFFILFFIFFACQLSKNMLGVTTLYFFFLSLPSGQSLSLDCQMLEVHRHSARQS